MNLNEYCRAEEKKKHEMLNQFEEEERHVQEVFEMRKRELDLQNEKKKLNLQLKHDNVDRVKRMGEYKRFNTLKKIEDTDKCVFILFYLKPNNLLYLFSFMYLDCCFFIIIGALRF